MALNLACKRLNVRSQSIVFLQIYGNQLLLRILYSNSGQLFKREQRERKQEEESLSKSKSHRRSEKTGKLHTRIGRTEIPIPFSV